MIFAAVVPVRAQAPAPFSPGDAGVTGFSGATLAAGGIAPGVDPVDKTVIDIEAAALRVFDLSTLGAAPAGQVINPAIKFDAKAKDIGHVFGAAFDDGGGSGPPNLYVAATSYFGLQIVAGKRDASGQPVRLKAGAPGAQFMAGQFGGLTGSSPGTIFRIDGRTHAVSVFAATDTGGLPNSGSGLGGLAFDAVSRSLFASDLDTGLIHRFPIDSGGLSTAQYDHGQTGLKAGGRTVLADDGIRLDIASSKFKPGDPATWGMTAAKRRTGALAVREGRLFYGVADGPEVWSVAINADGTFGADARLETPIKSGKPAFVAALGFDNEGRLLAGLRGTTKSPFDFSRFTDPDSGTVLRFEPVAGAATGANRWSAEPKDFAIGAGTGNTGASGGIGLGHGHTPDGAIDPTRCSATLIAAGDGLANPAVDEAVVHGLQINAADLVRPANMPPANSVFVDTDQRLGNKDARGHVGGVAAFQNCAAAGAPVVAEGTDGEGSPPVDGAAGPAVAGGGPPVAGGNALPVVGEDGLPVVEDAATGADAATVDPNAPNIAVNKTQQCALAGPEKLECTYNITASNTGAQPFTFSNASFEDFFSVVPETLEVPGGAQKTAAGFTSTSAGGTIQPGQASPGLPLKAIFKVPPGGLTVENCAIVSFGAPASGTPSTPGGAANTPEQARVSLPSPEGRCIDSKDTTGPLADKQFCVFDIKISGRNDAAFRLETDIKADGNFTPFSGTTATTVDGVANVEVPAAVLGGLPDPAEIQVQGTFPKGPKPKATLIAENAMTTGPTSSGPQTLAEQAKAKSAVSPAIRVAEGPLKNDSKTPGCEVLPDGNKACQWFLDVSNPKSDFKGTKFAVTSSVPAKGNLRTDQFGQNPVSNATADGKTFELSVDVPKGSSNVFVSGIFPGDQPDPVLTATTLDFGTPANPAAIEAALAQDGAAPGAGTGSPDSNPDDNTACVSFDTNNPDAPADMTREPTQGPPLVADDPAAVPAKGKVTVTKTGVPKCLNRQGGCEFTVTVKNEGTEPIAGPINLEERVSLNDLGVSSTKLIIGPEPPFTCGPLAEVMTCSLAGPLGPGESRVLKLNFAPSSGKEAIKTIKNCVTAVGLAPQVCATIAVEEDPPLKPNLIVKKSILGAGGNHCPVHGPCAFHIAVTNKGPGTFVGPLSVKDFMPGAASSTASTTVESMRIIKGSSPGWNCTKARPDEMDCSNDGVMLQPGGFLILLVEVVAGDSWKNLTDNNMENCAQLTYEGGDPQQPREETRSCTTVKLDPFDVAVVKTGAQSCAPGKDCKFNLDIFNPGNIPHDDPVTVTDKLTGIGNAEIVSLTAAAGADAFPCNPPPKTAPFTCTGHMKLAVGEHNNYEVVIRIPPDATGSFTNCASVGGSTGGSEDQSCQPVKIGPEETTTLSCPAGWTGTHPGCKPPLTGGTDGTIDTPKAADTCTGGLAMNAAGRCDCILPSYWSGKMCLTPASLPPPPVACPAGWSGVYPSCNPPGQTGGMNATQDVDDDPPKRTTTTPNTKPPKLTGGTNLSRDDDGRPATKQVCKGARPVGTWPNCCPQGTYYQGGACRIPKPANQNQNTGPKINPDDFRKDCYGKKIPVWQKCKPPKVAQPKPLVCPPGTYLDGRVCRKPVPQPKTPTSTSNKFKLPPSPTPDKRVNYGASANDNKPSPSKPVRRIGRRCDKGMSWDVVQNKCTQVVNTK